MTAEIQEAIGRFAPKLNFNPREKYLLRHAGFRRISGLNPSSDSIPAC